MSGSFRFDATREQRTGLPEAIFCASKTAAQIDVILNQLEGRAPRLLLTRLDAAKLAALAPNWQARLDYDQVSATAILGASVPGTRGRVAIVTGGTGDASVAHEAARTLAFHGHAVSLFEDVGVAGLWRLLAVRDEIAAFPVVIACAGMEGALFSVLAGLVPGFVIAVPVGHGYGVGLGGRAALDSALTSCAPGIVVVNIDNGYGAACAAVRAFSLASIPHTTA